MNILDQLPIEAGAFYLMDMGYFDYHRLYRIQQSGGFSSLGQKKTWHLIWYTVILQEKN